jgi:hypothetical protein
MADARAFRERQLTAPRQSPAEAAAAKAFERIEQTFANRPDPGRRSTPIPKGEVRFAVAQVLKTPPVYTSTVEK